MELYHTGSDLAQFRGKGSEAVGFLVADVGDVADGGRSLSEASHGGESHDGVGDVIHVRFKMEIR